MIKKFLSVILMITLTFGGMMISTHAMETGEHSVVGTQISSQTVGKKIYYFKLLLVNGITAILSGLFGYKICYDRRVADAKEITLVGSIDPTPGLTPELRRYYADKMLTNFINKLFIEDIPRLSKENEFPASHLAAIEYYLRVLSHRYDAENLPYKYRELAEDLVSMSQHIGTYVDRRNKKITLGYLKELLKDTQELLKKATATTREMEAEKEQKKAEL